MLNVTLTHSDKYYPKQQRPDSLVWREEGRTQSQPNQGLH